jgi:cytochrome c
VGIIAEELGGAGGSIMPSWCSWLASRGRAYDCGEGRRHDPERHPRKLMMRIPVILAAGGVAFLVTTALQAQKASDERGRVFAETNCARCHAIGTTGESPLVKAPAFRTLHKRYPVENLEEALAEGIRTAHPEMPQFEMDPDQINDLLAYLKFLERND